LVDASEFTLGVGQGKQFAMDWSRVGGECRPSDEAGCKSKENIGSHQNSDRLIQV
jgi:hypothetical protein